MADEVVVPEAPVVETPKAPDANESLIDNRRAQIENLVIAENETVPESAVAPSPEVKETVEETKVPVEADPVEHIKNAMQKRINKLTAKTKTVEEENAELKAELESLKAPKTPDATTPQAKTDSPTPEQVEDYIAKMQEEGNHKEAAAAIRYLVKLEKDIALKEVKDEQTKVQKESDEKVARTNAQLKVLAEDYVGRDAQGNPDAKHDLTLSNKNGLLFKTAISLYNDHDLHKDFYNDPDVVRGFGRAVADAYREIHQQGLIKNAPKGEVIPRIPRQVLAEPDAEAVEETPVNTSNSLSDAEKVREEIKARNQNRFKR